MLKNIIFDFDGTLADSWQVLINSLPVVFAKQRLPIPENISEYVIRNTDLKDYLKSHRLWFFKLKGVESIVQNYQLKHKEDVKLYDGIEELLTTLKENGFKLYIVSTNTNKFVTEYVKENHLSHYFDDIRAGGTMFGKAAVLKSFMKKNRLKLEETIYVGDEERDIHASKKLGLKVVSVAWGYKSFEFLSKHEPNYIVKEVSELEKLILNQLTN